MGHHQVQTVPGWTTTLHCGHRSPPILNNHRLYEIENPRLQHLKTRVMVYNFSAEWVKGVLNSAPDALSRNPVSDQQPQEMLAERDTSNNPEITIAEIRALGQKENIRLQGVHKHAELDHEYEQLRHYIHNGFPEHRAQLPDECKRHLNIRSQLALDNDLILYMVAVCSH